MGNYSFRDLMALHGLQEGTSTNGRMFFDTSDMAVAARLVRDAAELGVRVQQIPINKNGGKRFFRVLAADVEEEIGMLKFEEALKRYEEQMAEKEKQRTKRMAEKLPEVPKAMKISVKKKVGRPAKSEGRRIGQFVVESGVPLPPVTNRLDGKLMVRRQKYPLKKMKVGESFFAELRPWDKKDTLLMLRRRLTFAVNKAERQTRATFLIGQDGKGFRVWRTS